MPPSGNNPPSINRAATAKERTTIFSIPQPPLLKQHRPLIWCLVPYWIEAGTLKGESYDVSAYKAELADAFAELNLPWIMQLVIHPTIDTVIAQIAECLKLRPTLVFNLCDGYDEVGTPGLSVVKALEAANVPFTGADSRYYQTTCSKIEMKELFRKFAVPTAVWEALPDHGPLTGLCERLGHPLFIKPSASSASYGIGLKSVVHNDQEAASRRDELKQGEFGKLFANDIIYAEDFIDGPEFTVLMGGYWDDPDNIWTLPPAERIFDVSIPENERFLSYDRYWGYYKEETPPEGGRAFYSYRAATPEQAKILFDIAKRAYIATWGYSYGRVDIRFNKKSNEYQVLEVNANCGLSGDAETSCGSILAMAGVRFPQLVEKILEEALARGPK
jgi:D-alanine-D-alanine ligase-like ATP-grasp enzyme